MANTYLVGVEFDIVGGNENPLDYSIIYSHPSIEDFFLFEYDFLPVFYSSKEWKELVIGKEYRIFAVFEISPDWSESEYGKELDGWIWVEYLIFRISDLGKHSHD